MHNLLLATGSPVLVMGLTDIITEVIGPCNIQVANSFTEACTILRTGNTGMLVLETQLLERENTRLAIHRLTGQNPGLKVLLMVGNIGNMAKRELYLDGVLGIFNMDSPIVEIRACLARVHNNELYIGRDMLFSLLNIKRETDPQRREGGDLFETLTKRETATAKLFMEGRTNAQICKLLHIRATTVSTLKSRIYKKLGVRNLIELAMLGQSYGVCGNGP